MFLTLIIAYAKIEPYFNRGEDFGQARISFKNRTNA